MSTKMPGLFGSVECDVLKHIIVFMSRTWESSDLPDWASLPPYELAAPSIDSSHGTSKHPEGLLKNLSLLI
jgi:hypothetical protein